MYVYAYTPPWSCHYSLQEGEVALLGALLPGEWSYPHAIVIPIIKFDYFVQSAYIYIFVCVHSTSMGSYIQYILHHNNASSSKAPVVAGPGPLPSAIEVPPPQRSRSANETRLSGPKKNNENDPKRRPKISKMIWKDPKWTWKMKIMKAIEGPFMQQPRQNAD